MTHTPGPWDTSRDATPEYHYQATVSDEGGERVATAFVSEANARLIAAAPDLLAAADYASRMLDGRMVGCQDGDDKNIDLLGECLRELRDAIAKAEGR